MNDNLLLYASENSLKKPMPKIPIQYQKHWTAKDNIAETILPEAPPRVNSPDIQDTPPLKALGKSQ